LALARQLRRRPETRDIPFVLVTAMKDPDLRRQAMGLGAAGLVEKPYDAGELLELAQYALGDTQVCIRRPPASASLPPAAPPGTKKILIVEDDPRIAKALSVRLQATGFQPMTAHDALSAVSTGVKAQPDLMLLDISMPAGNGFRVAEQLHALIPTHPPVIFLTASKEPRLRDQAAALGAVGYFEKPFDADALLSAIHGALRTR
jgi:CheY-like chemotaxis protein